MSSLHTVHVVRRFGPVGGMERYVWELSRALARRGHRVTVLCERLCADEAPDGVEMVALGEVAAKPRWLAHLRFSRRVTRWLRRHRPPGAIVHSHERTACHDVTTFHGPPFARVRERPWWKRLSPRIAAQLRLERREVCGDNVRLVVPNAALIADMLATHYPCIGARMSTPIPPGTAPLPRRPARGVPTDGGTVGFVGKEWRRKGLDLAAEIVARLRRTRPGVRFVVAGAEPAEVAHLFGEGERVTLLGETEIETLYPQLDLLLHPARDEPFGMVITEALRAGVPVIVSDRCGAAPEIRPGWGHVLPLEHSTQAWAEACDALLTNEGATRIDYRRDWETVATAYEEYYRRLAGAS